MESLEKRKSKNNRPFVFGNLKVISFIILI